MIKNIVTKFIVIIYIIFNTNHCLRNLPVSEKQLSFIQAFLLSYPNIEILGGYPTIYEGQSKTIYIRLKNQPIDGVLVPITINSELVQANVNTLYFSPENWNTLQTIQLDAPNDDYYYDSHTTFIGFGPFESNDILYNGRTNSLNLNYFDYDMKGFAYSIFPFDGRVDEGNDLTLYISLYSKPRDNVTVNLLNPSPSDLTFSSTALTFTPSNWNIQQTVQITAIDDTLLEYDENFNITINTSSNDTIFNNLEYTIPITIIDNDIPGIKVNISSFDILEGDSQNINIRLNTAPTDNVNVNITAAPISLCTISSGSSLTFTPANYNINQTFTVQAKPINNIDDFNESTGVDNKCTIQIQATSTDPLYDGLNRQLIGHIYDYLNAGIILTNTTLPSINESDTTGTSFGIRLSSEPTQPVKICLKSSNYCEAYIDSAGINPPDGTCTPIAGINTPYIVFNNTNWNTVQTVTVKPRHDWDYRSTPTEDGNTCNPPYPDGSKTYNIYFYTYCPSCNNNEKIHYHTNTSPHSININGDVIDDLDYYAFVTPAGHDGNFNGDPSLGGSNGIERADSFCIQQKPSGLSGTFKAFLVDGTNRYCQDASTCSFRFDWMLKAYKYYFRYEDNQLMFKTDGNALFILSDPDSNGFYGTTNIWTGIAYTTLWSNSLSNCSGWSSNINIDIGKYGIPNKNTYNAVSNLSGITCDTELKLLCINQ